MNGHSDYYFEMINEIIEQDELAMKDFEEEVKWMKYLDAMDIQGELDKNGY